MTHEGPPRGLAAVRLTASTLLLLVGLTACTGGDADEEPDTDPPQGASPQVVETASALGRVAGQLSRPARRAALDDVVAVVDAWIDAAHVGGEWPRAVGAEAYEGFTPDAARAAEQDAALTSAAEISEQVEAVTVKRRAVRVDLVGARGRPAGATARVVLTYDAAGEETRTVRVRGRLLLTPTQQGWKVFGHDLTEETR